MTVVTTNPYLEEFSQLIDRDSKFESLEMKYYERRWELTEKYSFAIPNDEAIQLLVEHSPILEVGAGGGYWAWLVTQVGGEVLAIDNKSRILHVEHNKWFDVKRKKPYRTVKENPDHTLFLCWPEYNNPFAYNCLSMYKGNRVVFVGEWSGCCADEKFFDLLEKEWEIETEIRIPQWPFIHDNLWSLVRKDN